MCAKHVFSRRNGEVFMMVNQTDTLDGYSVSIFCRFLQTIRLTFPFLQIFARTGALTSAPRWSQLSDFIFSTKMLCALCPSSYDRTANGNKQINCENYPSKNLKIKQNFRNFMPEKTLSSLVRRMRSVTAAKTAENVIFLRH